ncbi:SEC-C metal-binding domain-containing protein [Psychrobacter aestuarii]|uniref:SEC-C metal-binding domain-containing protein n=1 Tax=Psychrobacter aestuarii TaxID=556327 RepID=A0ABN0VLL3_9GAMM|nr:SEC-C metal-binding domain-containing protein [Psychrobacter aestuarii]
MFDRESHRDEAEVFSDLESLCHSNGYLHTIAYFCFRDNTVRCGEEIQKEDFLEQYSTDRLLRTEISTLIGLACTVKSNLELPTPAKMQEYIDKTESLLLELHHSMVPDISNLFKLDTNNQLDKSYNPFNKGTFLREPIFYGGESAYHFQYRDLSKLKYKNDEDWIIENKGYSINDLFVVIESISSLQLEKINSILPNVLQKNSDEWTVLDAYIFTINEVEAKLSIPLSKPLIKKVIESFVSIDSYEFKRLDDFNQKNAFPIIKIDDNKYLLFQNYSLLEALYESPFFWFWNDKSYRNTAMTNRGNFTEDFSVSRLKSVFGNNRVFQGVNIIGKKGVTSGEIDVLVLFANRAIVLQAKSKKLTLESRKGNDLSIKNDFKKAIQDSYDQAYLCSELLLSKSYKLEDKYGQSIDISNIEFQEIYPVCIVSDHYPALSFQAKQFLKYKKTDIIKAPFIMDVFFLDVFAEMLNTPLYFLSYLNRRTNYSDSIMATHEMTILAYHLIHNLWVDGADYIHIGNDFNTVLDMSMLTRRDGLDSIHTPKGILTKYQGTTVGKYLSDIERINNPSTVDFGFLLLKINEQSIQQVNETIELICSKSLVDGKNHDFTIGFKNGEGLTIHCNYNDYNTAKEKLEDHARKRKYYTKSKKWHAICIEPSTKNIKFGMSLDFPWKYSKEMEQATSRMVKPLSTFNSKTKIMPKKIGRNEQCPCGSRKKYKKCCL